MPLDHLSRNLHRERPLLADSGRVPDYHGLFRTTAKALQGWLNDSVHQWTSLRCVDTAELKLIPS